MKRETPYLDVTLIDDSENHYKMPMYVEEYKGGPAIDAVLYDYLTKNVYSQTNAPVLFRLGKNGPYFNVRRENGIPGNTLVIPQEWLDEFDIDAGGSPDFIYVLKPGRSYLMHQSNILQNGLDKYGLGEYDVR